MNVERKVLVGKRGYLLASALLGVGLTLPAAGCGKSPRAAGGQKEAEQEEVLPTVQTITVGREPITRSITQPGSIEGYESADLYAKVGGYLDTIQVDIGSRIEGPQYDSEGKRIAPGEELARLSIPEMEKERAQKLALIAQARAEKKQAEASRDQALADEVRAQAQQSLALASKAKAVAERKYRETSHQLISQLVADRATIQDRQIEARFQLDAAEAAVVEADARIKQAEAEVAAARKKTAKAEADVVSAGEQIKVTQADLEHLETMARYAVIRAPFPGVVTARHLHPGAFVQPAEGNSAARPLMTVVRTDRLRIVVNLPMSEVPWLEVGDKAEVRVETLPGEMPFDAHVVRFSPGLDRSTRTMRVELELDRADPRILPGSYVSATVHLAHYPEEKGEQPPPVLPANALRTDKEGKYVLVVEGGRCLRRPVETFYEDGKKVGIRSGLSGGETVVTTSREPISAGQMVATTREPVSAGQHARRGK